jgi:hypothetical protein
MHLYLPIVKTLKKATPTVRTADGIVKKWDIEVVYAFAGDVDNVAWSTSFSTTEDVEYLGKTVAQWTKTELVALMDVVHENHIFHAHYEAHNKPPTEDRQEISISDIPD